MKKFKQFLIGFVSCLLFLGSIGVCDAVLKGSGGALGVANITSGTIDGATIGGTTAAAGTFTPLTVGAAGSQAILQGDAANTLAQRNSTTGQCFRVYNTFTDASNYERGEMCWSGNVLTIASAAAGTGTTRALNLNAPTGKLVNLQVAGVSIGSIGANGLILATAAVANQLRLTQTTVPTVTTNGGTSPVCVGTDTAMRCTEGTSPPAAATFTVTFQGTWAAAPSCVAMRGTAGASPLVQNVVTTTTTVQVNLSANLVASEIYHIHCVGVA
jgi:hypothetical protein